MLGFAFSEHKSPPTTPTKKPTTGGSGMTSLGNMPPLGGSGMGSLAGAPSLSGQGGAKGEMEEETCRHNSKISYAPCSFRVRIKIMVRD